MEIPFNNKLLKYATFCFPREQISPGNENIICLVCAEWCSDYFNLYGDWDDIENPEKFNVDVQTNEDEEDFPPSQDVLKICYQCYQNYADFFNEPTEETKNINILGRDFSVQFTMRE